MIRSSAEIRQAFLDFFEEHGHQVVASSSLVPTGDPTLLFTNAGMNQFKDLFLGVEKRAYQRAVTAQKCMRVSGKHNDLENVGPSPRHHTFFEMLGNFSFGDYFKRDAIRYAWDFLTEVIGLPIERLWFTVYQDDDEAVALWQDVGAAPERILRFGEKDNFWAMGDTGPCGPNSEIHYYTGDLARQHASGVNSDDPHYIEIWNLVFMQFNRDSSGKLTPLPKPSVDTGLGLERMCMVLQDAEASYDTDLFTPIMNRIQALRGESDAERKAHETSYRVIADHCRALTFLIADGVLPANDGRGYVLRLILRRAARHGNMIGFRAPFLAQVSEAVIETMGHHYTELPRRKELVARVLTQEEERFQRTLENGLVLLNDLVADVKRQGAKVIPGAEAFRLYDTHGFPLELTKDVAREEGLTVDEEGYRRALELQRQISQGGEHFKTEGIEQQQVYVQVLERLRREGKLYDTGVRHPYADTMQTEGEVLALLKDQQPVLSAAPGDAVEVVLAETPFYVESGGQVADTGVIARYPDGTVLAPDGLPMGGAPLWEIRIDEAVRRIPGLIVHRGKVAVGMPMVGDPAWALVDIERRWDIMRNHTATHLLHGELRYVLGEHAHQAGSLVAPDRLRFDFTHAGMMTQDELDAVEQSVNDAVLAAYPVTVEFSSYKEAVATGAMALFGEKYGDIVRVIRVGWPEGYVSQELCGGTHVTNTSEVGLFHIVSESSVGSGVRRIEAVTGRAAHQLVQESMKRLQVTATYLGTSANEVDRRVLALLDELNHAQKELAQLRRSAAEQEMTQLLGRAEAVGATRILSARVNATDVDTMREMSDWLRDRLRSAVVVLGAAIDGRPNIIVAITPDLVERGLHAGQLVKVVAQAVGGGGGGKPTLAQAGGRDVSRLPEALSLVRPWVEQKLGS